MTNELGAPFYGGNPRPRRPRWIVPNMLSVSAFQFRDPDAVIVLPKADNPPPHKDYWIIRDKPVIIRKDH